MSELIAKASHPGFTPGQRDVETLLDELARCDDDTALVIEPALLRNPEALRPLLVARLQQAVRPYRGRLVRMLGRLARSAPELAVALLGYASDDDDKTAAAAVAALAYFPSPACEDLLLGLLGDAKRERRRALVRTLGKVGGQKTARFLQRFKTGDDAELVRLVAKSALMAERNAVREVLSSVAMHAELPKPLTILASCRPGLESLMMQDIGGKVVRPGQVELTLTAPLATLSQARVMERFAIVWPCRDLRDVDALAKALLSTQAVLLPLTSGRVRFRLQWPKARDADLWAVAARLTGTDLINDPKDAVWEIEVLEQALALYPKHWDQRFAYRSQFVHAGSHPTIAAALVRVAEVKADDVVWDPFVGSGGELAECLTQAGCVTLFGSDIDPKAIQAAETNLTAAGARQATLLVQDAFEFAAVSPSLIITNPPMGRRVLRGQDLATFLTRFVAKAASCLQPGGRLVWASPAPEVTAQAAMQQGLKLGARYPFDMGGFPAEIQRFDKSPAS